MIAKPDRITEMVHKVLAYERLQFQVYHEIAHKFRVFACKVNQYQQNYDTFSYNSCVFYQNLAIPASLFFLLFLEIVEIAEFL